MNATRSAFSRPATLEAAPSASSDPTFVLQLSSPPVVSGPNSWRVLGFEPSRKPEPDAALAYLTRIGQELSRALNSRVYLLHVQPGGAWEFITWDKGEETERGGSSTSPPAAAPTLWRRFRKDLGLDDTLSVLRGWERERGLPVKQLLAVTAHKPRRVVDYDTVAGLERKGLLVENARLWYRFEVK